MLMEEVDAKVITREMVARQAAEEATTWVVEDGTYEATVSKYEEVPEDKLFDSERNAGVRAYNVDFQCYDVPGKASKVQNQASRKNHHKPTSCQKPLNEPRP